MFNKSEDDDDILGNIGIKIELGDPVIHLDTEDEPLNRSRIEDHNRDEAETEILPTT